MKIDAHHHFWRYDPREYAWISARMGALRRDFLPRDLEPLIRSAGLDGAISVQARHSLDETRFLLRQAHASDLALAVVGWLPLAAAGLDAALAEFATEEKLRGCRHALQDEADDEYMLRSDFNRGLEAVTAAGLAYDLLIYERHLPQTLRVVDRHPRQVFVLDHIGKPRISDGSFDAWHVHISSLGKRPNVYCKISGMATEADWADWTYGQMLPYLDAVMEAFGAGRLMYGSDWPVCLLATTYSRWFKAVSRYVGALSEFERSRILGGTAAEAYGIR